MIGKDDYTKRLQFYVEHTMKSIPMNIDDLDYQMGYIRSDEAGKFIAFLADKDLMGAINGCSEGTISLREMIYEYQLSFNAPFFITKDYNAWKNSFEADVDGQGRKLFKELCVKVAYDGDEVVGFIQYGKSAFGFDEQGEISENVHYHVIRDLAFPADSMDIGQSLLDHALKDFYSDGTVYAFFHYFGLSCCARHGKLHESQSHIHDLLLKNGFVVDTKTSIIPKFLQIRMTMD